MKRFMTLAAAVALSGALCFCHVANAQTQPSTPAAAPATAPAPAAKHRSFASYLKQLGLTPAQKSQIKTISASFKAQVATIKGDATLTPPEKTTKLKQVHKQTIKAMMAVLTPTQQAQLKQLRAQAKANPAP